MLGRAMDGMFLTLKPDQIAPWMNPE